MPAKTIIVTGISGSGSREFCSRYQTENKKVKIYHTGDMIYDRAQRISSTKIPTGHLLNLHPYILNELRDKVFEEIIDNLDSDRKKYDRVLIDTHAQFFWNHVYTNAYDWKHLSEIPADMFLTIIDKPSSIKANQIQRHGHIQEHNLRDLLLWQNVEVNVTKGWASNYRKPMYVFSRKQNTQDIDALLKNSLLIYASFPMTDASEKDTIKINRFKQRLRGLRKKIDGYYTPMINPSDIDIEIGEYLSIPEKQAIDRQTIHRDSNWDIEEATHVIADYPNAEVDLSKGVSDECTRAIETGKVAYVICPRQRLSPFMYIATRVFKSEKEFLEFFEVQIIKDLEFYERR